MHQGKSLTEKVFPVFVALLSLLCLCMSAPCFDTPRLLHLSAHAMVLLDSKAITSRLYLAGTSAQHMCIFACD